VDEIPGRLAGHVGVITGAGQGIGRGIALAMAKEGASVALAGRTLRKVRDVAGEVTELGGRALALECDVRWREQVDAAMAATVAVFGRIDSLVNNAQSSSQQTLEETTEQHADEC
jgi:NAD(P)-dependent dehydrogenase (short-subunit alcohol dehydrogenase family)